jgi:NAD(P)-dependent dehydrogenase (short-subunit alcohol dehydrogenase family)
MGKLSGKVAIVTGSGRGIGKAIAEAYLKEDARVTVTAAQQRDEIEALVQTNGPEKVLALLVDVTVPGDCERIVTETLGRFEKVDVLVNNAGRRMKYVSSDFLTEPTRFWETDPDAWRMVIDTNVNGPFFMARAVVPWMLEQGGGSIINISVNYETMERRGFSPCGPSKAALESESIIWAQDLEDTGIGLNVVLPGGATETDMIPPGVPDEVRSRLLQPEIIGPPAVYLASDSSWHLSGRRLVATEWTPENPVGRPAADGLVLPRTYS